MAMLRMNGLATIIGSKELPHEVKQQIMSASEGKAKAIRVVLKDHEGNEIVLRGKLELSSKGSLMARFANVIKSFKLVEVDRPQAKDKEAEAKERAKTLARELTNL